MPDTPPNSVVPNATPDWIVNAVREAGSSGLPCHNLTDEEVREIIRRHAPASSPVGKYTSHTPGPWRADKGGIDGDEPERWVVLTDTEPAYFIAEIQNGAPGDTLQTEGINAALIAAAPSLLEENDELNRVFDLRWKADLRAISRWREAHPGNELRMPDHADLCVWLLEQDASLRSRLAAPVHTQDEMFREGA